jgi:hypothetical protein
MAEEGTLGAARASREGDDEEVPSKEELQRRMDEARNSITQTVTEIKETVTNQYYSVKETVTDALDWRHHFRKNPVAFSIGALSAGFVVGYALAGTIKGGREVGNRDDYPTYDETDVYARTGATPQRYAGEHSSTEDHSVFHGHSYASQPILDDSRGESSDYTPRQSYEADREEGARGGDYGLSQGGSSKARSEEEVDRGPGLLERFKGTTAYDRLQTEVATLGDRFMDELSSTAQTVVLPALFNKIKEMFGVDLSGKQGQEQKGSGSERAEEVRSGSQGTNAQAASASATAGAAPPRGSSTGSSYATSENRAYGAQGQAGESNKSESDSVLDLDR